MGQFIVEIRGESGHRRLVQLDATMHVGRAPENDLVVQDVEVSWRHALIYEDAGAIWVRDLGSRNGILVDGHKINGPTRLSARSRIRIGQVELSVRPGPWNKPLLLQETGTGMQHPLVHERFVVGPSALADLQHPELVAPITLIIPGNGEVWVGHEDDDRPIEIGEELEIGGFAFSVVEGDPRRVPTVEATGSPYAYALTAMLDGGPGPLAVLRDIENESECRFTAETRAILLYTLGRQVAADRDAGLAPADEGWVQDTDLVVAVWGRTPLNEGFARLKTLVHRVRTDCREVGLDPWCLEKRRGHTRVRVQQLQISAGP